MLSHAIELAKLGLKVFALYYPIFENGRVRCSCGHEDCTDIGKHPIGTGFLTTATADLSTVRREWTTHKRANIGVLCGQTVDVLDVDTDMGGDVSIIGLETQWGKLPQTWRVRTGSGGCHVYFAATGKLRNRVRFAPGLDVRSTGGYVVGVGSVHASGNVYQWEPDYSPSDCDLAPMPEWLVEEIMGATAQKSECGSPPPPPGGWAPPTGQYADARYWLEYYLQRAEPGNRNQFGFHLAQQLLDNVYQFDLASERELVDVMTEYARRCPGSGYTTREAVRSFYSALNERLTTGYREPAGPGERIAGLVYPTTERDGHTDAEADGKEPGAEPERRILTLSELLNSKPEPVHWLVRDLVPKDGISLIAADAGLGKTWTTLHLALAVGYGMPFLGRYPTEQGRVVYFDAESSVSLLRRRLQRLFVSLLIERSLTADGPVAIVPEPLRIDTAKHLADTTELIREQKADLVVVDPLVHSLLGPENDSQTVARFFELVRSIQAATGTCFLFTHHSRKRSALNPNDAGQMLRGSTAIRGILDSYIFMRRIGQGRLLFEHDKCRVAEAVRPFIVEIADLDDSATAVRYVGEATESSRDKDVVAKAFITRTVSDAGGTLSRQELRTMAKGQEITARTFERALRDLVAEGVLLRMMEGKTANFTLRTDPESEHV